MFGKSEGDRAYFWNDLLGPLIYTDTDTWKPLSLGIFAQARTSFSTNYSLFFTIVVLMVLPLVGMFEQPRPLPTSIGQPVLRRSDGHVEISRHHNERGTT